MVEKKKPISGAVVESETYRHDANNNVIDQTVDGTQAQFTYTDTGWSPLPAGAAPLPTTTTRSGALTPPRTANAVTAALCYQD